MAEANTIAVAEKVRVLRYVTPVWLKWVLVDESKETLYEVETGGEGRCGYFSFIMGLRKLHNRMLPFQALSSIFRRRVLAPGKNIEVYRDNIENEVNIYLGNWWKNIAKPVMANIMGSSIADEIAKKTLVNMRGTRGKKFLKI